RRLAVLDAAADARGHALAPTEARRDRRARRRSWGAARRALPRAALRWTHRRLPHRRADRGRERARDRGHGATASHPSAITEARSGLTFPAAGLALLSLEKPRRSSRCRSLFS